jgi:hypothetical protein
MLAVDAMELLAGLASDESEIEEAAKLYGAAEALREQTGYQLRIFPTGRDQLQDALGRSNWERLRQEGQALGVDGIITAYLSGPNDVVA